MDEKLINKALDGVKTTEEQDKAIKANKLKFIKLVKACFKFCNPCKQIVAQGGNYQEKLCPKCKKILEKLK